MTEANLSTNVNTETGEIMQGEMIVQDTPEYTVVKLPDGKFKKNMKYQQYHSFVPETQEDIIHLYNVMNDSKNELVTPLKNMIKKEITINLFSLTLDWLFILGLIAKGENGKIKICF